MTNGEKKGKHEMTTVKFMVNRYNNQRSVSIRRNGWTNAYMPVTPASLVRIENLMRRGEIKQEIDKTYITYTVIFNR